MHMRRDYRLAYTLVPDAIDEEGLGRPVVAVLMIGRKTRDRRARLPATFELLHDILGAEFVAGTQDRTPCCENGSPQISEADVEDAMRLLRKFL
jgi:hypothetical protein